MVEIDTHLVPLVLYIASNIWHRLVVSCHIIDRRKFHYCFCAILAWAVLTASFSCWMTLSGFGSLKIAVPATITLLPTFLCQIQRPTLGHQIEDTDLHLRIHRLS